MRGADELEVCGADDFPHAASDAIATTATASAAAMRGPLFSRDLALRISRYCPMGLSRGGAARRPFDGMFTSKLGVCAEFTRHALRVAPGVIHNRSLELPRERGVNDDGRVSVRLSALGVVLACVLTACSSDKSDPKPTSAVPTVSVSTPSSSPTTTRPVSTPASVRPSPSEPLTTGPNVRPGEKPPVLTAAAREHSPAGARLFAEYYFRAFDWGYATNDPYLVKQISEPNCKGCKIYLDSLLGLKKRHETLYGGRVTIDSAKLYKGYFELRADYIVDVAVSEDPVKIQNSRLVTRTVTSTISKNHSLVFVSWVRGAWKIREITA